MIGVLPVDKPEGPTSHDVVAAARRALGERRIGHTGTLDPFASGLLLLCIGPATRLAEYLTGLEKTYHAVARLGVATDTLDRTGEVVARSDAWEGMEEAAIRAAFESQVGIRLQTPPAFSAKKLGGRKAYELARQGIAVEPEPVEVTIHEIGVESVEGPHVAFSLRCSSGTYVRAVARDAGDTLGTGAHLTTLRRTRIGAFEVSAGLTMEALEDRAAVETALLRPLDAMAQFPAVALTGTEAEDVRHGRPVDAGNRIDGAEAQPPEEPEAPPRGVVVLSHGGELLAIAERDGARLRPRKVFT